VTKKIEQTTFPPKEGREIVIGLSGGVDSATLAHLAQKHYGSISALYVDHGQTSSKKMEEVAISISKNHSFPLDIQRIKPSSKNATETELRKLRFEIYKEKVLDSGNLLLLGHHSNDRLETFFINLLRGTRLNGLRSITYENENLYRPLIDVTKEEIISYALKNNLLFLEDPTNKEERITRNWLRNIILPSLSVRANRDLTHTIEIISKEITELKEEKSFTDKYIKFIPGYLEVPIALVSKEGAKERNLVINLLEKLKKEGIEEKNFENLFSTINTGKEVDIFGNWKASKSNGLLVLINSEFWPKKILYDTTLDVITWNNFYFNNNPDTLTFNSWNFIGDKNKIKGKIHIRRMTKGDTIETDTGRQKVSELLRSSGYSNSIRSIWPIFTDEEKVLWIPGVRTSISVYAEDPNGNLQTISGEFRYIGM
tara:strand:- start:9657 stop:10937 length:1281 start_codon:yes stop_codon:yes gene_type:complete